MRLLLDRLESPVGTLLLVSDGSSLRSLDFIDYEERALKLIRRRFGESDLVEADDPQGFSAVFRAYFAGDLRAPESLPVATGGTAFQERVWAELRRIPVGRTITYGDLARTLGQPTASRAVGLANGLNPIAIAVPCHRVIGGNGKLTGYAGGLHRKEWLLRHEGALAPVSPDLFG